MFQFIKTEKVIPIRLEFSVPKTQTRVQPAITRKFTTLTKKFFDTFPSTSYLTKSKPITNLKQFPTTQEEYKQHFESNQRETVTSTTYKICYSMKTLTTLAEIRKDPDIKQLLKDSKAYIKYYKW